MLGVISPLALPSCRSPCGERGLKYLANRATIRADARRSPCGERGLKFVEIRLCHRVALVAPRAGSVG